MPGPIQRLVALAAWCALVVALVAGRRRAGVNAGRNKLHTQRGRRLVIRRATGHRVSVTVQSASAAGLTGRGITQSESRGRRGGRHR
jgi:hypothetical protein